LRFNRQRREVCVTRPDGSFWFVPWERVHAIAPSATQLGPYGAGTSGALIIWLPLEGQEHEPYHPDKEGWVMMTSPGSGNSAMARADTMRSFWEVGTADGPGPNVAHNDASGLTHCYVHVYSTAVVGGDFMSLFYWAAVVHLVNFNIVRMEYLLPEKLAHRPAP